MNREIKFKFVFQHPESKEVIISGGYTLELIMETSVDEIQENVCNCDCDPSGEASYKECNCDEYYMAFELIGKRQFTGLKDKNGKEIYEGDILHFQTYESGGFFKTGIYCYAEVIFGEHNLTNDSLYRSIGFYLLTGKSHTPTSILYWLTSHKATVAGNIHENKELLNQ